MSTLAAVLKVRLEVEQREELERRAEQVERPASAIARRAIADYLARWAETGEEPRRA